MISYQSEHGTQMKNEVQKIVNAIFKMEKSKHNYFSICADKAKMAQNMHIGTHIHKY